MCSLHRAIGVVPVALLAYLAASILVPFIYTYLHVLYVYLERMHVEKSYSIWVPGIKLRSSGFWQVPLPAEPSSRALSSFLPYGIL